MASDLQTAVESIRDRLRANSADADAVQRCGDELAEIGATATSLIESEFGRLVGPAEPSAA